MNWIELKALHKLYTDGSVKLNETLMNSNEINYLINSLRKVEQNPKILSALPG